MNTVIYRDNILRIMREAGEIMASAELTFKDIQNKSSQRDIVTKYDVLVQKFLMNELKTLYPETAFYCEESPAYDRSERRQGLCFIIDPIDGTANFTRYAHHSAISIAMEYEGKIIFSAVYNPFTDEMFMAKAGGGAYLNGTPIHCSGRPIHESIVCFGTSPYQPNNTALTFRLAQTMYEKSLDIRRSGSAALDICYVAAGRYDFYFELELSPWDFAAGTLIITEAGGGIRQFEGKALDFRDKCSVIAGDAGAMAEFDRIYEEVMRENA